MKNRSEHIVIIVPTYNEKRVIGELLDAIEQETNKIKHHQFSILIVDGNSPDGTAQIIRNKSNAHQNIRLIVEKKKQGLGIAYLSGIKYAISELKADAILEFDGDFQHNPKDIRRLVSELDNGHDYVIGSRYVAGGEVPKTWEWYRKLLSRWGNIIIKYILNLPTSDNTSGFKLCRVKKFAENLPLKEDTMLSKNYAYKIQFLYEIVKIMKAGVKEVPIKFLARKQGSSKSTPQDIIDSLLVVLKLRFRKTN